jgi:DNA-binding protein HU-beta
MNKIELADKISEKVGLPKAQVEHILNTFVDVTIDTLKSGGDVTLTGFGAFSARKRKGREGINPRNPSEKITIPSVVVAKFKAGKNLKEALKASGNSSSTETASSEASDSSPTEESGEKSEE